MGQRGPKPKPTRLMLLHGNPSDHRLPTDEPAGVGDLWAPPDWMDEDQRAQWHHAVEHAPKGLLSGTDRETLTIWVCACVEHARAARAVRREGQIVTTTEGRPLQNPRLRTMNEQAQIMLKVGDRLGFSPSARTSLGRAGMSAPGQLIGDKLQAYLDAKPDRLEN